MTRIRRGIEREELAALVMDSLRAKGIDAVLVGGSVVAIYSHGVYVTDDLDIVSHAPLKVIAPAMAELGFTITGNTAEHPETALYVQFCAPPLAVGSEPVEPIEHETRHGTITTLSATDCVLDRLMSFYHWGDKQALEQAVLVARAQPVDLKRIRTRSARENKLAEHATFRARLRKR